MSFAIAILQETFVRVLKNLTKKKHLDLSFPEAIPVEIQVEFI
jgi:hypothetical protein